MRRRRRSKRIWYILLGVFIAVFLFSFLTQRFKGDEDVDAASLANFDPGYIISDWQMSNYTSMSEAEIQKFLTSKNSCPNTNYNYYLALSSNSSYKWHWANGHFVCLSEERFGDGEVIGSGDTAAHIIWQAAQDYKINPQVILVLLQKETSLITDPIPNNGDYRKATGYGCPDTAPCSSQYYGFKNQVRKAAALFRTVLDGGWTNYPLGNNYVQYNPNSACGGSIVNIRSLATSALYRYTPYQPNAGALAAGYGTAYCGAYGNRNFYLYFQDWFGGITRIEQLKSVKIPNGTYYIKAVFAPTKAIDAYAASDENGTNIQIYNSNNSAAQRWNFIYNKNTDDYTITNAISGKAIDVYGAGKEDGTNVQLYQPNNSCAQRWKVIDLGSGQVKFLSVCSMKALQTVDDIGASGTNVNISTDIDADNQKWLLEPIGEIEEGLYTIASAKDVNKKLDIKGGVNSAVGGTNVHLYRKNNTAAQRWYISKTGDGYYTIKNLQTNKLIDVKSGSTANYANVQIWMNNNACAQKWKALKVGDNYTFISACSFKVMDLYGGYVDDYTNIQIYEANNSLAQKWLLTPISIVKDGIYTIISGVSTNTDMALDLWGNSSDSGTNIQIYRSNLSLAQKWTVKYDKNTDYYKIANTGVGNKYLDVKSASKISGSNVQLWDNNTSCAQKWIIAKEVDYYYIYSACSNLALDVYGAYDINGTNVQVYKPNNSKAQRWFLR